MSTAFYYSQPGGKASGPLEWDAIRAAYHAGRLPKDSLVAQQDSGPWVGIAAVERAGMAAFLRHEVPQIRTVEAAVPNNQARPTPFVVPMLAAVLETVGMVGLIGSAVCLIFGIAMGMMMWALLGVSSALSSGLCVAIGKILADVAWLRWKMEK